MKKLIALSCARDDAPGQKNKIPTDATTPNTFSFVILVSFSFPMGATVMSTSTNSDTGPREDGSLSLLQADAVSKKDEVSVMSMTWHMNVSGLC